MLVSHRIGIKLARTAHTVISFAGQLNWRRTAFRVHRLRVGQHFEVPGVGTDERSRNRFRSGLYTAARLDRVSVRGLPDGSVRVTKVGEWSNLRV